MTDAYSDDLAIYKRLAPMVYRAMVGTADEALAHHFSNVLTVFKHAMLFDCRRLPLGFVEDTGEAALEDMEATGEPFALPWDECYFEFAESNCAVAWAMDVPIEDRPSETVRSPFVFGLHDHPELDVLDRYASVMSGWTAGHKPNGQCELIEFSAEPSTGDTNGAVSLYCNYLVVGAIALLNDQLVIETERPDPRPYINAKRRAKGKLPISGPQRLLTVNVPRIRYVTSGNSAGGTHASPALHWRRGHNRMLPGKGNELPRSVRVKRCLVGDPARGYIKPKGYRLVPNARGMAEKMAELQ